MRPQRLRLAALPAVPLLALALAGCTSSQGTGAGATVATSSESLMTTAASDSAMATAASATPSTVPSSPPSGTAAGTAEPSGCPAAEQVRTALQRFGDPATYPADGVSSAVADARDALDRLRQSGGDRWAPQIDKVQQAVDALNAQVRNLGSGGLAEGITRLRDAGQQVVDSGQALLEEIGRTCSTS